MVAAALVMQTPYSHAQHASAPAGPSEKEKAKAAEKRAFEKDTDEAYKATLSNEAPRKTIAPDAPPGMTNFRRETNGPFLGLKFSTPLNNEFFKPGR